MRSLFITLLAGAMGCTSTPSQRTFTESVGESFKECSPSEIRFLAQKHNFSPAFDYCGSNKFRQFQWSPDGKHLYFELTFTHHIMDAVAENKATITVPTKSPSGTGTWFSNTRIALPVTGTLEDPEGAERIIVFDFEQVSVFERLLVSYHEVTALQPGATSSDVLFRARHDGTTSVFSLDIDSGKVTPAFIWHQAKVDQFDYTAQSDLVVFNAENSVSVYKATSGEMVGTWSPAQRGTIHPGGQWLMLEHLGEPISVFGQRAWDEVSENARKREEKRLKQYEEILPASYPTTVRPPVLSVVNLKNGSRWEFGAFGGTDFQWYKAVDYYGSFLLWGFEGKQLHTNVMLGNLRDRLSYIERGEEMLGVRKMEMPK